MKWFRYKGGDMGDGILVSLFKGCLGWALIFIIFLVILKSLLGWNLTS